MRLVITRRSLATLVNAVKGAAAEKSALPVLANVLLVAKDGQLRATATDLYRLTSLTTPCEVESVGAVCLPVSDLAVRVAKLPDAPVAIEVDGNSHATLRAVGTSRRFTVHGIHGGEFPSLPPTPTDYSWSFSGATLQSLMSHTYYAMSSDATRAHVHASLVEWDAESVRMVATDGNRLSLDVAAAAPGGSGSVLIPEPAAREIRRILADAEDTATVRLAIAMPWVHVSVGDDGLMFAFKIAAEPSQFPPYRQVMPKHERAALVNREAFKSAVSSICVAADTLGCVKLTFAASAVHITAASADKGDGFDEVAASQYDGEEFTIGINARYLLDAIGSVDSDLLTIGVNGPLEPLVVRGDGEFRGIVMPMRV